MTAANRSILLLGGSDAGKTNFLARLWLALREKKGLLKVRGVPADIAYIEAAVKHLLQGEFAPHSSRDVPRKDFRALIQLDGATSDAVEIVVPDASGELWTRAVETREVDKPWMEAIEQASGAIIFVRVLSDSLCSPLDWATAKRLLEGGVRNDDEDKLPTQAFLSELLTFVEHKLAGGRGVPRVAVIVTAWDMLDDERASKPPAAFLEDEFPAFAGRVRDATRLEVEIFGASVVGGDLKADTDFKQRFLEAGINGAGYVAVPDGAGVRSEVDFTLPVAWLLGADLRSRKA